MEKTESSQRYGRSCRQRRLFICRTNFIPVLVLGTVLGNTAGTIFYQIVEGVFLKLHFSIGRTVRSEYILEITEMIRKCALRRFC